MDVIYAFIIIHVYHYRFNYGFGFQLFVIESRHVVYTTILCSVGDSVMK